MLRNSWILACGAVAVGVLAACSDDADTTTSTTATTATSSTASTSSAGGSGGGETNTTTTAGGAGGEATTTSAGGDTTTTSAGGAGGAGGGGMEEPVNGCTLATAKDLTMNKLVSMTPDGKPWAIGYQNCVKVTAGTTVVWTGNFVAHPLSGGVSPTIDVMSPISKAKPANGDVQVNGLLAGEYPFFCTNHPNSMKGVVYVMP